MDRPWIDSVNAIDEEIMQVVHVAAPQHAQMQG